MMHRSFEPQPFLHGCKAAPKSQWVTVKALWYGASDWLEGLRRIWGRSEGKGVIARRSPFPVASSAETTPPVLGSNHIWLRPKASIRRINPRMTGSLALQKRDVS